ncbi:hypothetical protein ACMFMG_010735 [Clarireedia jacksonii]
MLTRSGATKYVLDNMHFYLESQVPPPNTLKNSIQLLDFASEMAYSSTTQLTNDQYHVAETLLDDPENNPLKVIGIGCGISGIMMAYKLQKGCKNVDLTMFDKNTDLGGTWFENRYPGAGCDIPSHAYSYNFALYPDWPNYCSFAPDIKKYLNKVSDVFGLRKYMQFDSEVTRCEWDEEKSMWEVKVEQKNSSGETITLTSFANVLLFATGVLNSTKWPEIEGLEKFKGKVIHTSKWPENYQEEQWAKEKVAVLGSGASSIQTVPAIQPYVKKLDVFIRTGSWFTAIVENFGMYHPYSEEDKKRFRNDPKALVDHAKGLEKEMAWAVDMMTINSPSQMDAKKIFSERMKQHIKDQRLYEGESTILGSFSERELSLSLVGFLPPWGVGCRRITPGDPYMKAIQEPNVQVHFTGAKSLTEKGVVGEDDIEREVDTVICATGFDTSYRPRFPIIGKGGVNLQDKWDDEPDAYYGLAVPDMPNFYLFMGPAWPVHNGSVMGPLVQVGNYIVSCIHKMQREQITSLTPRSDATSQFNEHVQEWLKRTVWTDNCPSWFKNKRTGRLNALWCGSGLHYTEAISSPKFEDFHIEYRNKNPFSYLGSGFTLAEKSGDMDPTPFLTESSLDPEWVAAMQSGDSETKNGAAISEVQMAYLGMGSIGQAMSKNLAKNGNLSKPLILWNRTHSKAIAHSETIGHSIAVPEICDAVSGADIIWSCFSGQTAVLESFEKILKSNIDLKGKLFLECSTITPEATNELAKRIISAGGEFVAMPVFGEPSMAAAAILTCLPAGEASSVQRILPYLNGVISKSVIDLSGSPPGTASHLKLIGNVLIVQMIESVSEAHVLAEKTKLKAEYLHQVITSVFPGPFAIYSHRMSSGDYYKKEVTTTLQHHNARMSESADEKTADCEYQDGAGCRGTCFAVGERVRDGFEGLQSW